MWELLASAFTGAVSGLLGGRIQKGIEKAAAPGTRPAQPEASERELLQDIRDTLKATDPKSKNTEGGGLLETAVQFSKPPYFTTIWTHGRRHMRLLSPAAITLQIQTSGGNYDSTLAAGTWHQLDLPDGSMIALHPEDTANTRTVLMRLDGR